MPTYHAPPILPPRRKKRKPHRRPPSRPAPVVGDAPQTRKQDFEKAERHKKKKTYKRAVKRAGRSKPAPQVGDAPGSRKSDFRKAERHKKKATYRKALRRAETHGGQGRRGTSIAPDSHDTERGREASDRAIRAARIRYVRRTRPSGKTLIKRELEGKGVLAKGLKKLGASASREYAKAHRAPGSATLSSTSPGTKLGKRAVEDLVNFPAQAIPSLYVPAAGAVEAARGHPQRIKKFVKDIDKGDPVFNLGAAGVETIKGNSKAASKRLETAKKSASAHPGFTALEVAGLKGGVGRATSRTLRGTGRTVRRVGRATGSKKVEARGERIRRVGSTERRTRRVAGTRQVEEQAYSRDSFRKARQVIQEKNKRHVTRKLREEAKRAEAKGHHEDAKRLRHEAARKDPDRVPEKEIKRRVDERIQVNEDTRRRNRAESAKRTRKVVSKAKHEREGALSTTTQRITRADRADIRDYIGELEAKFDGLTPAMKNSNKTLRRQLQKIVDDPKADMARLEAVASEYASLVRPLQRRLGQLFGTPERFEKAANIPYAARNMGATREGGRMVRPVNAVRVGGAEATENVPLRSLAVQAHMKQRGAGKAAFVTQRPDSRGAKNFNIRSERAPEISSKARSEKATVGGLFDASSEALVENVVRMQGVVDAGKGFRSLIKEFGVRDKAGKVARYRTRDQAMQAARDVLHDENGEPNPAAHAMRPIRLNPFTGGPKQLQKLLDDVDNLDSGEAVKIAEGMSDALQGKGSGPWALIPEAAAHRMMEHLSATGGGGGIKTLQLANQAFRKTVLSTSPGWFAGNIIEGLGRSALAHAGPRSYVSALRIERELKRINPKMYKELMSRAMGGGHFTSADRSHVRRGAETFEHTALAPVAEALGKFWRSPGPKQAADLWNRWTELVFRQVSGRIEHNIQTAMLGAALRKSPLMDQRFLKLSKKASQEAAQGLTKTETQVRFGREVDRMYGKYGKFSPAERKMIATYTPFAAWWLNSVYFVTRTLPRDHPVVTALIASAEQATEEWRKNHGLDIFMDSAVPGFLQGSIPVGQGKLRASRYTPFGAFTDPTGTIAGQVMPLWSSVAAPLTGKDWTGRDIRVKGADGKSREPTPTEKFGLALLAFTEATVPFYSRVKDVKERGPSALNPLKVTKPPKSQTTGSTRTIPKWVGGGSSGKWVGPGSGSGSGGWVTP